MSNAVAGIVSVGRRSGGAGAPAPACIRDGRAGCALAWSSIVRRGGRIVSLRARVLLAAAAAGAARLARRAQSR